MSTEANKRAVHELFARMSASDLAGMFALMTEDLSWRVAGNPDLSPAAGLYDKARLKRLFDHMLSQLPKGLQMKATNVIAEGDVVAAEAESSGDLRNGRQYRQQYHFHFTFRGDLIAIVREYLDTQHAFDVWLRPES